MSKLPVSPIGRVMKNSGAERVADDAREEMVGILEDYASELARKSVEVARYAGRKTVKAEDIELALKY